MIVHSVSCVGNIVAGITGLQGVGPMPKWQRESGNGGYAAFLLVNFGGQLDSPPVVSQLVLEMFGRLSLAFLSSMVRHL